MNLPAQRRAIRLLLNERDAADAMTLITLITIQRTVLR